MALIGYTSDLDTLLYSGSPVLPMYDDYRVISPEETEAVSHPGGLALAEVKYYNNPFHITASYVLADKMEADTFEVFMIEHIEECFIAHFMIKPGVTEPFVCRVIGDVSLDKTGYSARCTLKLEVDGGGL